MNSSIYSQLLISAGRDDSNTGAPSEETIGAYREGLGRNPLCGDQVRWFIRLEKKDSGSETRIADIRFEASGCLMCKASAGFLARFLQHKTLNEARVLYDEVARITDTQHEPEADSEAAGKEITEENAWRALAQIRDYPARRRCVIMPWDSFFRTLDQQQTPA